MIPCKRCRGLGEIYAFGEAWPCPCSLMKLGDHPCPFVRCNLKEGHQGRHAVFTPGCDVEWLSVNS